MSECVSRSGKHGPDEQRFRTQLSSFCLSVPKFRVTAFGAGLANCTRQNTGKTNSTAA